MEAGRLEERIGMTDELIKRACSIAMKAHKSPEKHYLHDKIRGSPLVVFGFAGSWSANDLFRDNSFGETNISRELFPSMRSIGNDETAKVNKAFTARFEDILRTLKNEVEKNIKKGKQIVFAGHSSGGPMAIFATLWFLEKYARAEGVPIMCRCVTFGSPLTGDKIFGHAIKRENWSHYFVHFVIKYDIVPRIMLAPLLSMEKELQKVLNFLKNFKFPISQDEVNRIANEARAFFMNVMRNASSVASHAACNLMGCTNVLLETLSNFIKLSPYRPFGTYVFCSTTGKLVVVENPDAVLQMLFYCTQLSSEAGVEEIAIRSLNEHMLYEKELQESLEMQTVICLDHLEKLPLSSVGNTMDEVTTALNDLGLSTRARLCLRAAGELEEQKIKNQSRIDSNKTNIEKALNKIQEYQKGCEVLRRNYYDAFRLQNNHTKDFDANVSRLELAGIWDEIIELLKRYELPDGFEGRKEWIKLGTRFRQLVEPLDVANYYRLLKNDDTGPYLTKGRPKRYRFTQRWHEHASRMEVGSSSGSCFWAEVEELRNKRFEDIKEKLKGLEKDVLKWICKGELGKDVFLDGCTFAEWWNTLPNQHRLTSCLAEHMTS